jgi:hypothetical protein
MERFFALRRSILPRVIRLMSSRSSQPDQELSDRATTEETIRGRSERFDRLGRILS